MNNFLLNKNKVLIVGSFPKPKAKQIYGGQLTSCTALINSEFSNIFNVDTLNSSSFTTPIPNKLVRAFYAFLRLIKFSFKMIIKKPDIILIFIAEKYSAFEKGLMILIAKFFKKKVMIFPRAGNLIEQYFRNSFLKKYINYTFTKSDSFLCQGLTFQKFAIDQLNFKKSEAPIIPNWTAKKEHLKLGANRNYYNQNYPKILFLGWLEEFKGVKEILEASKILKNDNYNFQLSLAGDGKCKIYVQNYKLFVIPLALIVNLF